MTHPHGAVTWLLTAGPAVLHRVWCSATRSDGSVHWLSLDGILSGDWWLPLSATIAHNGVEHLVVNLCLYTPVVSVLEPALGIIGSVGVYFAAALAGWVASLISSRLRYPESHAFVQTCGASPGLYGAMYCAAGLAPTASSSAHVWAWVLARAVLPSLAAVVFGEGRQGSTSAIRKLADSTAVGAVLAATAYILGADSSLAWLLLCNCINVSQRALQLIRMPHLRSLEYTAADEASHVGGAALGIAVAAAVSVSNADSSTTLLQAHWFVIAGVFFGLVLRHVTRF